MKEVEAIVLAGGFGSRMGEVTKDRQKCLLPIDSKPLLGHIIENLVVAFGSVDLKIALGYKEKQVKEYVDKNKPSKVSVTYTSHVLGIEGWKIYRDMKSYIKGQFIATPGDIIALPDVYIETFELFQSSHAEAALSFSKDLKNADTHGVGKINCEKVIELCWPPPQKIESDSFRDMTIWSSDLKIFPLLNKYESTGKGIGFAFAKIVNDRGEIAGNLYNSPWIHVSYVKDLQQSMLVSV